MSERLLPRGVDGGVDPGVDLRVGLRVDERSRLALTGRGLEARAG